MFFLEYYALMPVMIAILLLLMIVPYFNIGKDKRKFMGTKTVWIASDLLLIITMVSSYYFYQSAKTELKKHFLENEVVMCGYKNENIIIKKDVNYTLKDDYFIKNGIAIDIDNCKSLGNTDE